MLDSGAGHCGFGGFCWVDMFEANNTEHACVTIIIVTCVVEPRNVVFFFGNS